MDVKITALVIIVGLQGPILINIEHQLMNINFTRRGLNELPRFKWP